MRGHGGNRVVPVTLGVVFSLLILRYFSVGAPRSSSPSEGVRIPGAETSASQPPVRVSSASGSLAKEACASPKSRIRSLVMSCFFAKPDFYHGRKVPGREWIVVFLLSLFSVLDHAESKLVLFVDQRTLLDLSAHPKVQGLPPGLIELVEIKNTTKTPFLRERWAWGIPNGANNFRFALFRQWLLENRHFLNDGCRVLLTDVTDVAFQRNPFGSVCFGETVGDAVISFTLEHEKKNFANEKYNRRWMKCYGDHELRRLKNLKAPISCAGVTLGTLRGMELYLESQLEQISKPELVECAVSTIGAALDQATHNFLLHNPSKFVRGGSNNEHLAVVRLLHRTPCAFHGNFGVLRLVNETVVNEEGIPYAIVHQYTSERHPSVMEVMRRRYLS